MGLFWFHDLNLLMCTPSGSLFCHRDTELVKPYSFDALNSCWYLCVPGMMIRALELLHHVILTASLWTYKQPRNASTMAFILRWQTKRMRVRNVNVPKVAPLASDRAGIWTQGCLTPEKELSTIKLCCQLHLEMGFGAKALWSTDLLSLCKAHCRISAPAPLPHHLPLPLAAASSFLQPHPTEGLTFAYLEPKFLFLQEDVQRLCSFMT